MFAVVLKIYVIFLRFTYACAHIIIQAWYAILVFKFLVWLITHSYQ